MIVAGSRGGPHSRHHFRPYFRHHFRPYFRHHSSYEIFFIHSYPNDVTKATL